MGNDNWRQFAACKDMDPKVFHPPQKAGRMPYSLPLELAVPKGICYSCPAILPCQEYAIEFETSLNKNSQPEGIWGGLTPGERLKIKRKRLALKGSG